MITQVASSPLPLWVMKKTGYKIELTYNWGQEKPYDVGNGVGHIASAVDDIYSLCDCLKSEGVKMIRDPGPMKH